MRKKKKGGSERWELRALSNLHDDDDPLSTTFRMRIRPEGQDIDIDNIVKVCLEDEHTDALQLQLRTIPEILFNESRRRI